MALFVAKRIQIVLLSLSPHLLFFTLHPICNVYDVFSSNHHRHRRTMTKGVVVGDP
jgi:hypothetical protein